METPKAEAKKLEFRQLKTVTAHPDFGRPATVARLQGGAEGGFIGRLFGVIGFLAVEQPFEDVEMPFGVGLVATAQPDPR